MRNSLLHLVFDVLLLVLGAAAEDLLPRVCGVGFPILLAAALVVALRGRLAEMLIFAFAAGATEDALAALPTVASASFFLVAAWIVRLVGFPRTVAALVYPAYLVWLVIWTGGVDGGIYMRLLASVPIGFLTTCAVAVVYAAAERRAAINEIG